MGQKIYILGHRLEFSGRLFLCLFPQQNISDTLRCSGFVFLNDVAIKIFGGVHAGVSQLLGHRDNIRTICQQDGGNGVAEGVGIDVGQIVAG